MQTIDLLQHNPGTSSDADVVRQVNPPDKARWIHQELGRPRDVAGVFAGAGVQDSVSANDLSIRIGQEEKRITLVPAELARFLVGVDAEGGDLNAARAKLV